MKIVIAGEPIVKKRPKFSTQHGFMRTYDPQEMDKRKAKGELSILLDRCQIDHDEMLEFQTLPLSVNLQYFISPFASDSIQIRNKKLWGILWEGRKDIDNYEKWSLDIANGILWADDKQIVKLQAEIKYSETPCTIIEVTAIKIIMNDQADLLLRLFSPAALEKLESDLILLCQDLESHRLDIGGREHQVQRKEDLAARMIDFAQTYGHSMKKLAGKK
jgi:Holliday junction resolvase RusA-like endonuclease